MTTLTHTRLTKAFLAFNSLFWLPWGFVNLVWPKSWSGDVIEGLDVYDLSSAAARTEVRAMYGGLQMAIGAFALIGLISVAHRRSVMLFFTLALTGLALCRFGGMVAEGDDTYLRFAIDGIPAGRYNQVGLTMYELPNLVFAWVLLALGPRSAERRAIDALTAENDELRAQLTGPEVR